MRLSHHEREGVSERAMCAASALKFQQGEANAQDRILRDNLPEEPLRSFGAEIPTG
jgi:hypothetical protein